jgi:hypothetical protein
MSAIHMKLTATYASYFHFDDSIIRISNSRNGPVLHADVVRPIENYCVHDVLVVRDGDNIGFVSYGQYRYAAAQCI